MVFFPSDILDDEEEDEFDQKGDEMQGPQPLNRGRCLEHSGIVARWWIVSILGAVLLGTVNMMAANILFYELPELKKNLGDKISAMEMKQMLMERDIATIKGEYNAEHKGSHMR